MDDSTLKLECLKLAEGDVEKAETFYAFCKDLQESNSKQILKETHRDTETPYFDCGPATWGPSSRWYNTYTNLDVPFIPETSDEMTNEKAKEHVIDNHAFADNTTKNQY